MNHANENEVLQRIRPTRRIAASNSFRERVMKTISEESERTAQRWNWPRWVTVACAAALLLLILPLLPLKSPGVLLLAQSVQAMANVRTIHITGRIRTLPNDNFELIGAQYDFVPIEIWREFTNPPQWRVEKPGRVVVMNGQTSLLYIRGSNSAMAATPQANFFEWLRPLLDPQSILESELTAARKGTAQASVNGATVTLRRQARGNFANDWAHNKSIPESDHTCEYRFDAAGKRLEGLQVVVSGVVVAEFTDFRYDEPLAQSLFTVPLPADVNWMTEPESKPTQLSFQGPKEAAAYFFDALARESWENVVQVTWGTTVNPAMKRTYAGLQVISIGEPFQSGLFPGYFVPYEVRLRDGSTKGHKLAVRNDNAAHRWVVDGGY